MLVCRRNDCKILLLAVLAILSALAATSLPASAQEIDTCLECHEDDELTKNQAGSVISLYFDREQWEPSVHAAEGLDCSDCHTDLADGDFPHAEELSPPACSMCHEDEADIFAHSLHGRAVENGDPLAPRCWDCHGKHDVLSADIPESRVNRFNIPLMCGSCHKEGTPVARMYDIPQDSILTNYSLSIHGEGLYKRGLTISAVCTDCHTAHDVRDHEDSASSIHRENVAATCQKCHGRIEQVHQKVISGELWESEPHKVPVCIECHQPHEVRRVFYAEGMADRECLQCHQDPGLKMVRAGEEISLYVDETHLDDTAHRKVACAQCHIGATPSMERPCDTIVARVDCAVCHAEQVAQYNESTHGTLAARGDQDAPSCLDCHGIHDVRLKTDPRSSTYVSNVAALCAECHGEGGAADRRYTGDAGHMVENYAASVHGQAISESGLVVSANCTDCHTAHHVLPQDDRRSTIHRSRISETCSSCHQGIRETFITSIHFTGEADGDIELPMCDDCHSSHEITRTDARGFMREIVATCGKCHQDVTESYFDTFHGKVVKLGYTETAKCQDCHGSHDILPPEDPNSRLSRDNIVATCAECHEGSHRRFAGYLTHATHHDKDKYPFIYGTWLLMTILLVGTFSFFGIHTLLWLPRSIQAMRHARSLRSTSEASGAKQYRRFERLPRYLHILIIISFLGLAMTGMTLKFSYLPWAQWISHMLGGFQGTGVIHRICALITFFYFARHIVDLIGRHRRSGRSFRQFITDRESMAPNGRDLKEFVQTMKWFVGVGPRPRYGRWTYWEKFDYFAVFWGVGMIGFSGLILWFPEQFTLVLPGWFINVATIIHSDEALLATGFIFTVHFFNTHFRPDRFPMDPIIFTGRMSVEEFKEDRPREYEELVASGKLDEKLVEPMHPSMVKAFRIFGFTALTIGLALVVLIIWAELFGYR